jgi:hypothetical protein
MLVALGLSVVTGVITPAIADKVDTASVPYKPMRGDNEVEVAAMQEAARTLGIQLSSQHVRGRDELEVALDAMIKRASAGTYRDGRPVDV